MKRLTPGVRVATVFISITSMAGCASGTPDQAPVPDLDAAERKFYTSASTSANGLLVMFEFDPEIRQFQVSIANTSKQSVGIVSGYIMICAFDDNGKRVGLNFDPSRAELGYLDLTSLTMLGPNSTYTARIVLERPWLSAAKNRFGAFEKLRLVAVVPPVSDFFREDLKAAYARSKPYLLSSEVQSPELVIPSVEVFGQ